MKDLVSVRCTKLEQALYTETLLSSNLYLCHSGYHRDLWSHKYLLAECRAKNLT